MYMPPAKAASGHQPIAAGFIERNFYPKRCKDRPHRSPGLSRLQAVALNSGFEFADAANGGLV